MKTLLNLEYIALLVLGIAMFEQANYSWWWFAGLFFAPDLSMVGYLINTKIGAICYNFAHHLGVAILVFLLGKHFNMIELEMAGSVLLAHSAFDRVLGYGLKYNDSFKNTHLGRIGKENREV